MPLVQENTAFSPEAPIAPCESRGYRRVRIPLKARFMLADGIEHPARVRTISPAAAVIESDVRCRPGDTAIVYVDKIGRLEAVVTGLEPGLIRLQLDKRRARRIRTADALTWLVNRGTQDTSNRKSSRIRQESMAEAVREDGSVNHCRILDISVTGASVAIMPRPPVGTVLNIGRMRGRVVRHHETGVGMEFIKN